MFKSLMKLWSEQAFATRVVDEFISMLEKSEEMMEYAFKTLRKKGKTKAVQENIYNKDQSINIMERDIRKQILIHLSANPKCNISACLVLISISKDAERLGDYIKNIVELPNYLKDSKRDKVLFQTLFDKNGNDLLELIRKTKESFKNSDQELATEANTQGHNIATRCEEIIDEVVNSDYSSREAVVLALGARYMKRIAVHLSNVASSVINPLPELDFNITEE
ncbi:PhoU domain-containing protein [Candidatus Latescibacterota bacterium]